MNTAQQHNSTTAQQHNSTTAQQHNSTTAQQHNSTTAQQHNSTTHRYFYHLLYGLLIIICFFAYCKDDSDMVDPDDPGVVAPDDPGVVDPDDNKPPFVTLNLGCIKKRKEHANCSGTKTITITNTIKSDHLPIYTVKRVGPKDKPVTVTLMWDATGSSGSDRPTEYDPAPRIVPFLSSLTLGGSPVSADDAKNTCNELSDGSIALDDYISATHYSFKFIGGPDNEAPIVNEDDIIDASEDGTPGTKSDGGSIYSTHGTAGTVDVMGTLSVTIPAGSRTATFRLDPHRCPDSTTFFTSSPTTAFKEYGGTSGDTVVSIGIQSISDTSGFDDMSPPKALTITFPQNPAALDDDTKANLKKGIMDAFAGNTGTGTLDLDVDGNKGKLKTAQKEADKVAGMYGTEN